MLVTMTRLTCPGLSGLLVPFAAAVLAAAYAPLWADEDPRLAESRAVTAEYAARLQAALLDGMASGGPVAAIGACKDLAPQIAAILSAESGAVVSRTSSKVRNPQNRAADWQAAVLAAFERDRDDTEFFEIGDDGSARYMSAIPAGPLCLNCHGTVLAPDIRARLDEAYPADEARGYTLGDLRGAFSVVWPAAD